MINILKSKNNPFHLFLVWITLTSTAPFIFYSWPYHPYKYLAFGCLATMFIFLIDKKGKYLNKNIILIFLIQIIFFSVISFLYSAFRYINNVIQLISCMIIFSYINQYIGFKNFAKSYVIIMILMGIGGTITFFLHILIGIKPFFEVQYSATGTTYFLGLTSTNVFANVGSFRFLRFSGFFDEPGAFAMYSLFALLMNKIYYNNKKYELLLIATTIFTFSLAYYILIVVYFILFYNKIKYLKYYIFVTFIIMMLFLYLSNYNGDNQSIRYVKRYTVGRLEITDEGRLRGDNRSRKADIDREVFLNNFYWGDVVGSNVSGANVYSVLASHGIFGAMFYYLLIFYFVFLLFRYSKINNIYLKVMILVLANVFHRPEFVHPFMIISLYTLFKEMEYNELQQNAIKRQ